VYLLHLIKPYILQGKQAAMLKDKDNLVPAGAGHMDDESDDTPLAGAEDDEDYQQTLDLLGNCSSFEGNLLKWELYNYLGYIAKFPGHMMYMLGQHFERHPQHTRRGLLNTIIKNAGILMAPEYQRAMTPQEMLVSQAFPIYPWQISTACGMPVALCSAVCSFNLDRASRSLPPRKRTSVAGMAGNTMNVNVIGAASIWALAYVGRRDLVFAPPLSTLRYAVRGPNSAIVGDD
jgi:hypothetical protein